MLTFAGMLNLIVMLNRLRLMVIFAILLLLIPVKYSFAQPAGKITGDLVIFHAGSLSVPLKEVADEFKKANPGVNIMMEASGSVASARKITDLGKPCDILVSADFSLISTMLIPKYADWNIGFAGNELCVAYTEKSKYSESINAKNWMNILRQPDVIFGRSDPNADPCGYRTLMMLQLAENYYKKPGLYKQFAGKDNAYMRSKETDLLALLETGSVDYIFTYRSIALQHNLRYLLLPDQINLKNPAFANQYAVAKVDIHGQEPGKKITITGEPIIYGFTILRDAPNRAAALAFAEYLLDKEKGMKIMAGNGQPPIVPMKVDNDETVPAQLKPFLKK